MVGYVNGLPLFLTTMKASFPPASTPDTLLTSLILIIKLWYVLPLNCPNRHRKSYVRSRSVDPTRPSLVLLVVEPWGTTTSTTIHTPGSAHELRTTSTSKRIIWIRWKVNNNNKRITQRNKLPIVLVSELLVFLMSLVSSPCTFMLTCLDLRDCLYYLPLK